MQKLTAFFTELMRRYLPDPFVFAIGLTLLTMVLAVVVQGQAVTALATSWGKGFWTLLAFTTQMAVILAMGYVLATAPLVDRFLDRIVSHVNSPRMAIVVATLVGGIGSWLNWGFGLVVGGIVARKLALRVQGVHHPLIIASAYSGFTLYGLGLSASIPVLISTKGHPLEAQMGVIPLSETIFSPAMLMTSLATIVTLPLLNAWLHPKAGQPVKEIDRTREAAPTTAAPALDLDDGDTLANRLNHSRVLSYVIGAIGMGYVALHFVQGGSIDLNLINFFILFLGILLLGTPIRYVEKLNEGIRTIGGIILQYPFYAGIMAIMASSGLVETLSAAFVKIATPATLPFWGLVSSFVINFFAPSAGGHWVIQGPFMIEAAKTIGASVGHTSTAVMLGNAWNDLVQPFWILPALALSKLKLKDIMGYTVIMMFWVGIVYSVAILAWR
ncbi:short-chain fatty acid transporter [Burkholderia pseudomultivorans]|uniref:Short-chain fatty acid transporter n=1 Tax=Burkholderia pseudomultivorans TaxID=1207504 RepID=A0A132EJ49_9BURK|nr:TIGR00366 family protein [Burkholderia pseudomultivorans]KWF30270.1 short-chain fatty acid transporter [Burkholderia pseudomultivorans]MDR8726270.1 putative short-chain fatty acid transporter [Burkholderia pseudomultivorans]MDR8732954.1 putative short-chain fatty acid transporter [Burkholderia pseudomultivorans]MDR8739820.1 putative short-chain fatty acid transporter [Burkholderia pseudomultivorans]MDR8752462.1 putative short-chain fatty acid transporter [Burkholderia pseudomultivorans]